jgi:hypothetical protein
MGGKKIAPIFPNLNRLYVMHLVAIIWNGRPSKWPNHVCGIVLWNYRLLVTFLPVHNHMASTIKPLLCTLRGYHSKNFSQTNAHQPCVLCPEGFYCPDKATMIECGSIDVYCPLGSVLPTPVTAGYFTTYRRSRSQRQTSSTTNL